MNAPSTISGAVSPADPAWDEAFLRVESYLGAYGLSSRVALNQVTADIIAEARAQLPAGGTESPVTVAMKLTHQRIAAWLERIASASDRAANPMLTGPEGRLALAIADLPGRWADYFLSSDPPAGLAAAMRASQFPSGPDLQLTGMAPDPLEFGFPASEDPTRPSRRLWVSARTAVSWLLIVGFFGIAWAASH